MWKKAHQQTQTKQEQHRLNKYNNMQIYAQKIEEESASDSLKSSKQTAGDPSPCINLQTGRRWTKTPAQCLKASLPLCCQEMEKMSLADCLLQEELMTSGSNDHISPTFTSCLLSDKPAGRGKQRIHVMPSTGDKLEQDGLALQIRARSILPVHWFWSGSSDA